MTLSLKDLNAQLRELNIRIADAKRDEKRTALEAFKLQVDLYGISQEELLDALGFTKRKPARAPAKYYDPSTGKTWSGRGSMPKWLQGKNPDHYLVDRKPKTWWPGEDA
ncbi:H-NS family nucleoid-associated regulatory protein [Burkholderia ubonensis]|uniref:H-NS histone family protein n=1 Tax=Burkholderia ubonensis TaxID=101571 RepID=UPI0009B3C4FF|nr:H-NS histone family protein [Burkholderia ubonensis]